MYLSSKETIVSMVKKLPRILQWMEVLALIVTFTGIFFKTMSWVGASDMLLIGLFSLATAYFLSAFVMVPIEDDGQTKDFLDLLPTILRKVIFIALAVYCIGFLFSLLRLEGAAQQTLVSVLTLAIGVVISMALIVAKRERMTLLKAPLIRGIIALVFQLIWPLLGIA